MCRDSKNLKMVRLWSKHDVSIGEIKHWIDDGARSPAWKRYLYWKRILNMPAVVRSIEVGCGYGKFSMLLGMSGETVTLLDYNHDALSSASTCFQQIGLNPRVEARDIMELSEEMNGQFDLACSFGTLEHFAGESRRKAFGAMAQLLRPGGVLFFTVPNRFGIFYRIAWGLRKRLSLVTEDFYEEPYSPRELRLIAMSCAINPLEIGCVSMLKGDFEYWILENIRSVLRRVLKRKGVHSVGDSDLELESIDLSGASARDLGNYIDTHFSYNLLFVGQKQN